MYRGPQGRMRTGSIINQITGRLPMYRPKPNPTIVRVLPQFRDGAELPWVDFSVGVPGNNNGLGEQHCELDFVQIWWDGSKHCLAWESYEKPGDQPSKSPARYACERLTSLCREAEAAKKANANSDPRLVANKYDQFFITEWSTHMLQVLMLQHDGKQMLDPQTGQPRHVVLDMPFSALADLRTKLFTRRAFSNEEGATYEDNQLGDYCSCAGGFTLAIIPAPNNKYGVQLYQQWALPADVMATKVIPWNVLTAVPTHTDSVAALQSILPEDLFAYSLIGTPYEKFVPSSLIPLGQGVRAVLPVQQVQGWAPPQQGQQGQPPSAAVQPAPWQQPPTQAPTMPPPPMPPAPPQANNPRLPPNMEQLPHTGAPPAGQPPAFFGPAQQRPPVSPMAPVIPPLGTGQQASVPAPQDNGNPVITP